MAAICSICRFPAPNRLAMLQNCLHCFHTTCLRNYVAMYGHCPHAGCEALVGEEDIRVLIFDPPQPTGMPPRNQDANAGRAYEVLNAVMNRLNSLGIGNGSNQERAQVGQVGEAFELILREQAAQNGASSSNGEVANFRPASDGEEGGAQNGTSSANREVALAIRANDGEESGWDILWRIIQSKEAKVGALVAVLVLICVFWPLIGSVVGLFAAKMGEIVTGMLATMRAFLPEILAIGKLLPVFFFPNMLKG